MITSGVFAGIFSLEYGLAQEDADGKTLGAALQRIGYAGETLVGGVKEPGSAEYQTTREFVRKHSHASKKSSSLSCRPAISPGSMRQNGSMSWAPV